jgi:4-hydroxy-L-threonine phosphate dehydrogenase PdxA
VPQLPTIALAIGDPNGIGPELAVKAACATARSGGARLVLVGDRFVVERYIASEAPGWHLREVDASLPPPSNETLDLLAVDALPSAAFAPGIVDPAAGRATVEYVAAAVQAVQRGLAQAIVACPHSETAVNAAGIVFSGYPSLLARCAGVAEDRVFLMLVGGGLRIVHATLHERLADALRRLNAELVEAASRAAVAALGRLGIATPRIGVFGINPHAGENGLFGCDDDAITAPAVRTLREAGIAAEGPLGADLLLGRRDLDRLSRCITTRATSR